MCSVSAVHDYFRERTAVNQWDFNSLNQFKEIIRRLEALDEKLGQKDCIDPAKAAWVKDIEARLKKVERSASAGYEE